jgi:ABC-type uncharacterized transport system
MILVPSPRPRRLIWRRLVLLACAATAVGVLAAFGYAGERLPNVVSFAASCAGLLLLFALSLLLPARIGGSRWRGALWNALLAGGAVVVAALANVAVYRHDVHFDLSREGANTPPSQLQSIVDSLESDVLVTYFYNGTDVNASKARELLAIASRQNLHFSVRAMDLDKEPAAARRFGVRAYNTAVVEAADRRAVVENTVDLRQMAYAALRVLKRASDVVCFVTGHGESFSAEPPHLHFSHVETLKGHDVPGAGDVLVGKPDGLDRLQLALTTIGYSTRPVTLAALDGIPPDCAVVADIGPRRAFAPGEAEVLARYAEAGGRLLLMLDPDFPIGPEVAGFLGRMGLASEQATVIDPLNHYASDPDKVAVPYYPPHPITARIALTIFPDARPIRIEHPLPGIAAKILASSSNDSYLRPLLPTSEVAKRSLPASAEAGGAGRSPQILAVALEGRWPDAGPTPAKPFRLVLVGNSNFATNAYFPYVSNGDLAVGMIRWLAGDEALPALKPQSFSLERIDLTSRQMRDIFVVVELLLPLSVVLVGGMVWWMRR